ncbi:MAG: hypothetical protein IJ177_03285 [Fibrobacter sp.]|uniref:hypothetical protein n=1 Tax=unclassified Fibrobacter TaxID=2634177 RepID=UPI000BCAD528|nr:MULTISPECIES: hypothetical protein [unclassified Fibrobacter]MBQ9225197.1 hypothetical protein [Fibrobacter sp.]SOE54713.1 hypothetical protein SAMN05720781_0804 [Fibrobacter sp. UWT3]
MFSKMIYIFSLFSFFTLATASEKSASKEAECEKPVVENIVAFNGDTIKVNRTVRNDLTFEGVRLEYSYESIEKDLYFKDSVVYLDGTYEIAEKNGSLTKFRYKSGEEHYSQYDNEGKIIKSYIINMEENTKLYDEEGNLLPYYESVRGDTVFLETRLLNGGFWN